jgi:intergrase/recombinase
MKGLSALSKFLGCYEDFKLLVKNSGLKWMGKSADDIFIDRLNSVKDPEEIWNWVREVKKERPELTEFMDLMAVSGLRLIEAVNSFNLQGTLAREGKLYSSYFVAEKSTLEHYRFKEIFIRRSKKAFVSFVPEQLVQDISKLRPWVSTDAVQKMVQKRGLQLRFADIREAHATFMIKYLKKEEIDFLHGRVTSGVFMQHYFNPSLISDLKARAFQGVAEIQKKVRV